MLKAVPLMIIPMALYGIVALIFGAETLSATLTGFTLPSRALFLLSNGDALIIVALIALFVEVVKATRATTASVIDHALSTILLILCILAFILVPPFGTTTFLHITLMCLVDVIAGFSVSIGSARRDIDIDRGREF